MGATSTLDYLYSGEIEAPRTPETLTGSSGGGEGYPPPVDSSPMDDDFYTSREAAVRDDINTIDADSIVREYHEAARQTETNKRPGINKRFARLLGYVPIKEAIFSQPIKVSMNWQVDNPEGNIRYN